MRPLEAEDAGIFFGREAPTIEALDRLRGLAQAAAPRLLAVLGASGAGKSSFLRAGLAPRLMRDDRNFLMLPIVRPERAALHGEAGLIRCLEMAAKAHGLGKSRADIRTAVEDGPAAVEALLGDLAAGATVPDLGEGADTRPPRVVLAVDQGEELFLSEGSGEAATLLGLIRDLATSEGSALIVVFTIRSDSFEQLQTAPELDGLSLQTFNLPPMPRGAYQTVIEGPARRLADTDRVLTIEPALTEALLADIEAGGGKDALPLLAFALQRLYEEYGTGGKATLALAQYRALGGIRGSIEAAVKAALNEADADPAVPKDEAARLALLRRALIPWLAGIDPETGAPRRRVARLSEIPEEARPLVGHLITARLLATDVSRETGERTIEPAHEALLRQWGLLQGWLEEDFAALSTLEGVERAARDWDANGRDEAWLAHAAGRLEDAEALQRRADFAHFLDPTDVTYLDACRATETARRNRELEEAHKLAAAQKDAAEAATLAAERQKQVARRTRIGLVAASLLAVAAIGTAVFGFDQARKAQAKTAEAIRNETVGLAALSQVALAGGYPAEAVELALAAWRRPGDVRRPMLKLIPESLSAALPALFERLRLSGHDDAVGSAAFSPDGTRVVTASSDMTARIWDAATGAQLAVLTGHVEPVWHAAFSPDGTRVVTASSDKTARIWDAATGAQLAVLTGHEREVLTAAFSPDGTRVATASWDKTARIWDAATGAQLAVLTGHGDFVASAAFSPDGSRVVTASRDKTARIWDAATGAQLAVLTGHQNTVLSAVFSPDGTRVATASWDKTARIWDAATGAQIAVLTGHGDTVGSAAFSPDGTRVVTGSRDNTARIWDAATGAQIAVLTGHGNWVASALFSPDGTRVVTASRDKTARVWDAATGAQLTVFTGHENWVASAAFSPDGTRVVTASRDKTARIWDAATGARLAVFTGHKEEVWHAAFSPDGTRVVTASKDKTARIWNAATGAQLAVLTGHEGEVLTAAFSPDGTRVVTASGDKTARIWDAATGAQLAVLTGHEDGVLSAAFSPDGTRVVTASYDNTARIWDAATGAQLAVLTGHGDAVGSAAFSPDGTRVVTTSRDNTARIWDAATDAQLAVLTGHQNTVLSAAFSPDGTRVVTASWDKTARIWDAATGAQLAVLTGHGNTVWTAAFSPDGTRLVTASSDRTARIWDAATGAQLAALTGHGDAVISAAFSPDGTRVATASSDRSARIWDISHLERGEGFAIACARLGNNVDLTPVRERYHLGELAPICGDHPPMPVDLRALE